MGAKRQLVTLWGPMGAAELHWKSSGQWGSTQIWSHDSSGWGSQLQGNPLSSTQLCSHCIFYLPPSLFPFLVLRVLKSLVCYRAGRGEEKARSPETGR